MNVNTALADLVALVHGAFILFVLFGGLLALRWRWAPLVHLPAALWGAMIELFGWYCPLTPLEDSLRGTLDPTDPSAGFIERHLQPLIYPEELTRTLQFALAAVVIATNVVIYLLVWWRHRVRARGAGHGPVAGGHA